MLRTTLTIADSNLRGKSQPYELSKKNQISTLKHFLQFKTFRALKMIAWLFSSHHIEKRLNSNYTLPVKSN